MEKFPRITRIEYGKEIANILQEINQKLKQQNIPNNTTSTL